MANIIWPELLPSGLLADGFSKQPQSNIIRTSMDAGPKKARRRYTARTVKYSGKQVFDAAELAVFEQFYHNVIADGVLRFNFNDPVTGETAEFRFTEDYTVNEIEGYYEVTLSLERL
ncbi:MAG: hypothetical protein LBQ89_02000 [Treponema sp.]|jgi:hypothetical protein|nr:hypothetical protein [Treponema sp.]